MTKLIAAAAALALAGEARAQLVYEPFAYPVGSTIDGENNPTNGLPWSRMGSESDDDIVTTGTPIPYPTLAAPAGAAIAYSGAGKSERLALGPVITSGTAYYSMILNVSALENMGSTPALLAGFSNGTGTSAIQPTTVGARLYLRQASTSTPEAPAFNIGVSKNSSTLADISFAPAAYALNTPLFVVGSYTIHGTDPGTNDEAKLYINPTALGAGAAPAATLSAPLAGTDLFNAGPAVAGFVLRQGSANVPSVQVDELRIDTTWAQVTPPVGVTWSAEAGGSWSQGSNWSVGSAPSAADAFVNFGGAVSRTVTVDAPVNLRTITFTGTGSHLLNGSAALSFSSSAAINVRAGSHVISAPIALQGDLLTSVATGGSLTLNGELSAAGRRVTKAGAGTLNVPHLRAGELQVVGGTTKVAENGGPTGTSRVGQISVGARGILDLSDNDLVIDYTAQSPLGVWNGTAYTGVSGLIASGLNEGTWDGKGIITGQAAAVTGNTTLGIAEAASVLYLESGQTSLWSGQVVDDTTVLVRYTYIGDANLDGVIDADDYSAIDTNWRRKGASGYSQGDFNYDGVIDADDYSHIDTNYRRQIFGSLGDPLARESTLVSAVPEPGAISLLAMGAAMLHRRRRRVRRISAAKT